MSPFVVGRCGECGKVCDCGRMVEGSDGSHKCHECMEMADRSVGWACDTSPSWVKWTAWFLFGVVVVMAMSC